MFRKVISKCSLFAAVLIATVSFGNTAYASTISYDFTSYSSSVESFTYVDPTGTGVNFSAYGTTPYSSTSTPTIDFGFNVTFEVPGGLSFYLYEAGIGVLNLYSSPSLHTPGTYTFYDNYNGPESGVLVVATPEPGTLALLLSAVMSLLGIVALTNFRRTGLIKMV